MFWTEVLLEDEIKLYFKYPFSIKLKCLKSHTYSAAPRRVFAAIVAVIKVIIITYS